jgi:hypothetical protein
MFLRETLEILVLDLFPFIDLPMAQILNSIAYSIFLILCISTVFEVLLYAKQSSGIAELPFF